MKSGVVRLDQIMSRLDETLANNEQASLAFTAAFCFAHAESNLINFKLYNN